MILEVLVFSKIMILLLILFFFSMKLTKATISDYYLNVPESVAYDNLEYTQTTRTHTQTCTQTHTTNYKLHADLYSH